MTRSSASIYIEILDEMNVIGHEFRENTLWIGSTSDMDSSNGTLIVFSDKSDQQYPVWLVVDLDTYKTSTHRDIALIQSTVEKENSEHASMQRITEHELARDWGEYIIRESVMYLVDIAYLHDSDMRYFEVLWRSDRK